MARTNIVNKARKDQGNCAVCHKPINIGDSYKWVKPRYKGKIVACLACTIPLYMTSSSKMVAIYDEIATIDREDTDNAGDSLRGLAETVREIGEEYQTAADSQREVFPDSSVADDNEEKAQGLDGWADELDSKAEEADSASEELTTLREELSDPATSEERKEELESEIEVKESEIHDCCDELDNCPS